MDIPGARVKGDSVELDEKIKEISGKIVGNWKLQETGRYRSIVERAGAVPEPEAGGAIPEKSPS